MATLHLLSHSPFSDSRLSSCLRLLGADDGLLLTGDAVYALQPGTAQLQALELMPAGITLYALEERSEVEVFVLQVDVETVCEVWNWVINPSLVSLCDFAVAS